MRALFSVKNINEFKKIINFLGFKFTFCNYKKYVKTLESSVKNIEVLKDKNIALKEKLDIFSRFKYPNGINSNLGSYKEFFLNNNMPEKIQKLKSGLDKKSLKVVDYSLKKMLHLPDRAYRDFFRIDLNSFSEFIEADYERDGAKICKNELENWKIQYPLSVDNYDIEVLYAHHGLKRASQKILNYIKNKCFIDGGAYIGDSAIILHQYNPSKIYSFEMSEINCKNYIKTMELNNINPDKYELIRLGISDKKSEMKINDSGKNSTSLNQIGDIVVHTTDIDSYVFEKNLDIGFIKTDLEGFGLPALIGMTKTIQTCRPVLSMAIYHSPEEFFEIKPKLDEITKNLNYSIHVEHDFPKMDLISGTVIFAYPKELED